MAVYTAETLTKVGSQAAPRPILGQSSMILSAKNVFLSTTPTAAGGTLLTTSDVIRVINLPAGAMITRVWTRVVTANNGAAAATINYGTYKVSDGSAIAATGLASGVDAKTAVTANAVTVGAGSQITAPYVSTEPIYVGIAMGTACTAASVVPIVDVFVEVQFL